MRWPRRARKRLNFSYAGPVYLWRLKSMRIQIDHWNRHGAEATLCLRIRRRRGRIIRDYRQERPRPLLATAGPASPTQRIAALGPALCQYATLELKVASRKRIHHDLSGKAQSSPSGVAAKFDRAYAPRLRGRDLHA